MLVSMELAKHHLRVDPDYPDSQVSVYLGAAERLAEEFMNRKVYATAEDMAAAILSGDAGESPIVANDLILAAILLMLGHLHSNRENTVVGATVSTIPTGFEDLLRPFRLGMGV